MTKNLSLLLSAGGLALMSLNASAITYRDLDVFNPGSPLVGVKLDSGTTVLVGSFDIAGGDGGALDIAGYNPLTQQIDSASVIFRFRDEVGAAGLDTGADGTEYAKIDLDGVSPFLGPTEVNTVLVSPFTGAVLGSALVDLSADGVLSYIITRAPGIGAVQNDFFALSADLNVEASLIPVPVPDGGATLGLLGLACLGLGWAGRKLKGI